MRYYNYPKIDNDFGLITWVPNQGWMLGFAEQIIEKNRSKEMLVRFLNFERNSSRELKHDLERLLSDN